MSELQEVIDTLGYIDGQTLVMTTPAKPKESYGDRRDSPQKLNQHRVASLGENSDNVRRCNPFASAK